MFHFISSTISSTHAKKWAIIGFWVALIATSILMFVPGQPPKSTGFMHWDKIQHASVFMLLIKLAWAAYPHKKSLGAILLVIFGAVIEILQSALTTTRMGSTGDWIADIVGLIIGMSICALLLSNKYFQTNR